MKKAFVFLITIAFMPPVGGTNFNKYNNNITEIAAVGEIPDTTERLFLGGNLISTIQTGSLMNLPFLEIISLINNQIFMVEDYSFASVSSVTTIDLRQNQLEIVTRNMFSGAPNLENIYLSRIVIHTVEVKAFKQLNRLEVLKLDNNLLTTLQESVFDAQNPPSNLNLMLNNNPLQCDWQMCWLKELDLKDDGWISVYNPWNTRCDGPPQFPSWTWNALDTQLEKFFCKLTYTTFYAP